MNSTAQTADEAPRDTWALSCALAVGFALLSLLRAQVADLQGDETWTRLLVRLPLSDSFPFIVRDGKHPPLYPALQMILGNMLPDSAIGLRLPSIIAAALVPAFVFSYARRWGAPSIPAAILALWVGSHPILLTQAVNARSYAILALVVLVHGGALADYLATGSRRSLLLSGVCGAVAVMMHAFGVLFVGAVTAAGLAWCAIAARSVPTISWKHIVLSVLPAAALFCGWYGFVALSLRETTGMAAGLEWVDAPTIQDRGYTLGTLLGSADVERSTRTTLLLWAMLVVGLAVGSRRKKTLALGIGLVTLAAFGPFIAQNLASGIIVNKPLWGNRHVVPTVGLLALGFALSLRRDLLPRWWPGVLSVALVVLSCVSLSTMGQWRRTMLSDLASHLKALPGSTAVRVTYAYGDLNVLNFYLDRGCVDDFQLRVQFPDVRGPANPSTRSIHCVAKPVSAAVPDDQQRLIVVHRSFVKAEVQARDSLLARGWTTQYQFRSAAEFLVADVVARHP